MIEKGQVYKHCWKSAILHICVKGVTSEGICLARISSKLLTDIASDRLPSTHENQAGFGSRRGRIGYIFFMR